MKIKSYPYKKVRKLGEPRKNSNEIRVERWDEKKTIVIFIGNEKAWDLVKDKSYEIMNTKLIGNTDDDIYERNKNKKSFNPYHQMNWYFKIKNEKGNVRCYPQTLFALQDGGKE